MEHMRKTVAEMGFIKKPKITDQDLINYLDKAMTLICERFAFGSETGEGGFKHFQVRMVLKKDTWKPQDIAIYFADRGIVIANLKPTHVRNFDYVKKEGNFVCSWERSLMNYVNVKLNLWQILAMDRWEKQNDREILVIVDHKGAHGKTFLRKHLVATHRAEFIPPMERAEDIMAIAMFKPYHGYVIDLPKAESKARKSMWSAIEQIKDGYIYDKRYCWKERWIEPPKVMVFCNTYDEKDMSTDRWDVLDITDFKQEC